MVNKAQPFVNSSARQPQKEELTDSLNANALPALADSWLIAGEISQHSGGTTTNRRAVLSKLKWFLEKKQLGAVDVHTLRAFFLYVANGHKEPGGRWGNPKETKANKPETVRTYHRILKTFFLWLVGEGELTHSPMVRIPAPVSRPDQVNPFTQEQIEAMLSAVSGSRNPRRDEAILLLMLDTGIRASELCALNVGDADMTGLKLAVMEGKGNKSRFIPFSLETKRALYHWLRDRGIRAGDEGEPLFTAGNGANSGGRITRSGLLQLFVRLKRSTKMTGVRCSPHTMRHTFAVSYLRQGGNVFTLKATLGHESLAIVNRYVAIAQADMQAQHARYSPVAALKRNRGKGK